LKPEVVAGLDIMIVRELTAVFILANHAVSKPMLPANAKDLIHWFIKRARLIASAVSHLILP